MNINKMAEMELLIDTEILKEEMNWNTLNNGTLNVVE